MKVSGFTIAKDVIKQDYPAIESISSILPICDEFIINVGPSSDGTLELFYEFARKDKRIKIIQSQWNPNMNTGGFIYAQQTDIALFNCMGNWAFYIQLDEVVHENTLPAIQDELKFYLKEEKVEGLLLEEINFYHDPYIKYRKEVRKTKP